MKVALIYTSTTPELIELVEKETGNVLPWETEMASHQGPSILAEVRDTSYVTAPLAARLVDMHMTAISEGTDVILNLCSSIDEVVDAAQDIARYTGTLTVCADEEMCREAVRQGERVEVVATLSTILNPTKNTILGVTREMSRQVELVDVLVDDGSGLDQEQFKDLMGEYAGTIADKVDVTLSAWDPMVYYEEYIHKKYGKVVLPSPRFSAAVSKGALAKKGLV